jgi:exopolyphosphatase/guanosine-5'-triphosphate,3'-diphosphate pyrophosphatase
MQATPTTASPLLAAIDMGSNSFRLEIGQLQHGRYKRVDYLKETVRLGAGLDADGQLSEEAQARGLACLKRMAQRLADLQPGQVRAVATQTLREARNRDAFLQRAQTALGLPIEVISGREEARLIYAGVARLQPSDARRLVIDIGGRSTELILGQGLQPEAAESFAVGCVSLSMRFFPDGRLTAEAFRAAQVAAGAELEEALELFAPGRWVEALGSSGTAGAIAQVLQASGVTDGRITPAALRWCIERCIEAGHIHSIELPGLKPERRAVLPGGLCILYTLASFFSIDSLSAAKGALRQGVIFDLHQRQQAASGHTGRGDMRDASVAALQQRFGVDQAQAARVASVALRLLPLPPKTSRTTSDVEALRELGWAAALHEMGLLVSHHDHHRHSAYLVGHVDAAGFSQNQQRHLAELVLGQRGGLRKLEPALGNEAFAWQVMALRLAVIKCHHRGPVDAGHWRLQARGQEALLQFSAEWARQHPRTLYLLQEEAGAWARNGPLRLKLPG